MLSRYIQRAHGQFVDLGRLHERREQVREVADCITRSYNIVPSRH